MAKRSQVLIFCLASAIAGSVPFYRFHLPPPVISVSENRTGAGTPYQTTGVPAETPGLPAVQRIYTRCEWGLSTKSKKWFGGYGWHTQSSVLRGSFWVAQSSTGEPILVTANHILKPYSTLEDVKVLSSIVALAPDGHTIFTSGVPDSEWNILKSGWIGSSLTTLGYDITQLGTVAGIKDLALLKTDARVIARMKIYKLATHLPHDGEKVTAYGLPLNEPHQNRVEAKVNIVQGNFFTINVSLDPGFSGGVVLSESGDAYGFVSTVTERATTVYIVNGEALSSAEWRPYAPFSIQ